MTNDSGATRGWTPIPRPGAPPPAGAYSPGGRAGPLLFISGQVPRDPLTGALVGDDVPTQTRQCVRNLEAILHAAGATLADLVSVTVHLADPGDWGAFDATWRDLLPPPWPTRTVVGAALRGIQVEITAVAWLGER